MKIRKGFVSNSSSSTFILGFEDYPKYNELKEILIDSQPELFDNAPVSKETIFEIIWHDIKKGPAEIHEIVEVLSWSSAIPFSKSELSEGRKTERCNSINAVGIIHEYLKNNSEFCYLYKLSYGSDYGPVSNFIESSKIFWPLSHLLIDYH